MGKPSGSKRGFNCPSFKVVAAALQGEPFTVTELQDCWVYFYPKAAPTTTQLSMLLRGDARDGIYLVEHHSTRSRNEADGLGRNSIYAICDDWVSKNPVNIHAKRSGETYRD